MDFGLFHICCPPRLLCSADLSSLLIRGLFMVRKLFPVKVPFFAKKVYAAGTFTYHKKSPYVAVSMRFGLFVHIHDMAWVYPI